MDIVNLLNIDEKDKELYEKCREEVSKIGYDFGGKERMKKEISTIFNLLK